MARRAIDVQRAVIMALFLREIRTRFGKYRLGYLWAPGEPLLHLLILMAIFSFAMHRVLPDISFPVFLVNGLLPYLIFTNIAQRSMGAMEANQGLFNYRPVKPIDTIIARALLESSIYIVVYLLLSGGLMLMGESIDFSGFLTLVAVWALLIGYACGLALVFMVIGWRIPEMQRILPLVFKPLYFISCVMYPLHSIPKEYQVYLLWNPLLHIIELSRNAVVPGYSAENVSFSYLAFSTLLVLFSGLALYRTQEEAMLTS